MAASQQQIHARSTEMHLTLICVITDGALERRVSYVTPIEKNPIGPRSAECFEVWRMHQYSRGGFSSTCEARTPKVRWSLSRVRLHSSAHNYVVDSVVW